MEEAVLGVVRELTGSPAEALSAEMPLIEAGIDSLAANELLSRLRELTGMPMSPSLVFKPSPTGRLELVARA